VRDDPFTAPDNLQAALPGLIIDAIAVWAMSAPNVEDLPQDQIDKFVRTIVGRLFNTGDLIRLLRKTPRLNQLGIRVVLAALAIEKRGRGRPKKGTYPILSQSKRERALQHYRVIAEAVGRQAMYGQKEDLLKSIAKEYRVSVDQLRDDVGRKVAKK